MAAATRMRSATEGDARHVHSIVIIATRHALRIQAIRQDRTRRCFQGLCTGFFPGGGEIPRFRTEFGILSPGDQNSGL